MPSVRPAWFSTNQGSSFKRGQIPHWIERHRECQVAGSNPAFPQLQQVPIVRRGIFEGELAITSLQRSLTSWKQMSAVWPRMGTPCASKLQ